MISGTLTQYIADAIGHPVSKELLDLLNTVQVVSSTEIAFIDGVTPGTAAASKAVVLDSGGDVTWVDGGDIALGTGTGTKIGTAVGQKLGLWGATPVAQQSHADQGALTAGIGTASNTTLTAITDTSSDQSAPINNNFEKIAELLNRLRLDLVTIGAIKGSA